MNAFATINRAPGVYIQEIQLPGPIAGVGTSTAAFVGPARSGPMRVPQRLANWTRYVEIFGGVDGSPFIAQAPVYTPLAVQGFFDNGGSDCWFVRVGSAVEASLTLPDRSAAGNPTLVVTAKEGGAASNAITVAVTAAAPPLAATTALRASVPVVQAQNTTVQVGSPADARKFVIDDVVRVEDANNNETVTVVSVTGDTVNVEPALQNAYAAANPATLRLADVQPGATTIRLGDANGVPDVAHIESGSYLAISSGGGAAEHTVVQRVDSQSGRVWIAPPLQNALALDPASAPVDVVSEEFTMVIGATETFAQLSMDPRHTRYFRTLVDSALVTVAPADPPNPTRPPDNIPADTPNPPPTLAGGADDDPGNVSVAEFMRGIDTLKAIDEVNILCVPDSFDPAVQGHMISHCEQLQDRFAVLDPRPRADSATITIQRDGLGSDRGFAALYYPRIVVSDPVVAGRRVIVPPSGHLAGIYARVDSESGVFKAPANEIMRGVLDLERVVTEEEQGPLNENSINVIRSFPGRGAVVWGARTISKSTQWRYVNVRRFLLFVEESLKEGTLFTVFEPNTPRLWGRVKRQVTEFLTRQFAAGALVGTTPDEAFVVQVDAELNTPAVMALGQLIIKVKLYPATPAEFVVFQIIQQPGGPLVQE
jgi:phage tail sheath protein FI